MLQLRPIEGMGTVDARVRADQVDLLYEQAPGTLITSFLVAIFLGLVHRDMVSMHSYSAWVIVMLVVAALRLGLARTYWRKRHLGGNPDRWRIPYDIGAFINGLLWGAGVLLLFSSDHPVYQALLLVTIAAVIAGGVVALSSVREAAAMFMLPIVAIVSVRLFSESTEAHFWLGIAALVYAAFMLRLAQRAHKTTTRSLQLRHENDDLLAVLAQSKADTEALNEEITQARDEALRAAQVKSQFLATMSHEIRTPMNGVLGIADLLRITRLDEQQAHYVENIRRSGETLLAVINDVLDFSKIEAGKLRIEKIPFCIADLVQDVASLMSETARCKGLGLQINIPDHLKATWYEGDPARLRQVLINLLSNAIKFTDNGEVRVNLSTVKNGDDQSFLRIVVADTGIGISETAREHVFGAFTQADSSTTRNFGGTGLGLAICKQLVELIGGEIGVESEPGEGSRFWFTVPSDKVDAVREEREQDAPTPAAVEGTTLGLKVLIAEDNPVNQEITRAMLNTLGCESDVAKDGAAALRQLATQTYDAVLMDCQMPTMDGFEATRMLRAQEESSTKHLPVIALTADAMAEDRERCLAVGMDDYLSKPVTIEQLRRTLAYNIPS